MRGASEHPVTFLGFDAGSPTLVRRWVADGHLPNFARILSHGASATVEHEPGLFVGSVWPTTLTGVGVSRHGFYTGIRPAPFGYDYIPEAPLVDPFWVEVGRQDRRIWVTDAPFFAARSGLEGVQLVEWGCHDRYFGPHSEPPEALDAIVRAIGPHPIGMIDHELGYERFAPCDWVHLTDSRRSEAEVRDFIATLDRAIDHRVRLIDQRSAMGPFDLTVDIVAETHCGGHHLWSIHDETHVDHDSALRARLGVDPLLAVYERMDDLLGAHLDAIDDDGVAYVFLSHGMQAHHDGNPLFDELLWRLDQAYRGEPTPWVGAGAERVGGLLQKLSPSTRAHAMRALDPVLRRRLRAGAEAPTAPVPIPHPSERLWYALDNNTVAGAVRFNRIGREPRGLLSEAMTHHAMRWLERELRLLVNLDHGGPVVDAAFAAETLYERRDDDGLPDLLVDWVRDHPIERLWSPTIGLISRPYEGLRTGDHDAIGELVVTGPGIVPGRIGEIRPTDIAPTVAAAAGVFLRDVEGEPIPGLLPAAGAATRESHRALVSLHNEPLRPMSGEQHDADMRRELIELRRALHDLSAAHHETRAMAESAAATAAMAAEILATTSWIRGDVVTEDLLISVVLPTCGRLGRLTRAIDSVLRQTHTRLELVVVDDATDDGTAEWLSGLEDPRVVVLRNAERLGEGGSRNRALGIVSGEVVAFLDDDNRFDPDWLRAVAWLFSTQPDCRVAYGARVVDDVDRHHRQGEGGLPWLQLNPWDRATMAERNLVDMNTVAHRRSEARFDPELVMMTDWDYLLGLTVDCDPVRLPVLAAHYTTDAPGRASVVDSEVEKEMYDRVRDRWSPPR